MAGIGSTPSLLVGIAAGGAASAAFEPALEVPKQEAWASAANRIVDAATIARLVAQGGVDLSTARHFAHRDGYNDSQLDAMVYLAQTVPGLAQTMLLWRLGKASDTEFEQALVKGGMRQDWIDKIVAHLRSLPLSAEILAVMVQRGVIPNQKLLPFSTDVPAGNVPPMPVVDSIDAVAQAAANGTSLDQLTALARIQGLPPGMDLVARGVFRGVYVKDDFIRAAAESNRRQEWADTEFEVYREIPTARDYIDAYIRGWIKPHELYAGTARHGMSQADTDLLVKDYGRPMTHRQVFQAQIRGGVYDGPTTDIDPHFLKSLQESNVRPEWYNLEWAYRYTLPNYFVLHPLVASGAITVERCTQVLEQEGWPPDLAAAAANSFLKPTSTTATSYPTKAEGQLWTTTHNAYKNGEIDQATAEANLTTLGISPTDQAQIAKYWNAERATIRKQLSPTQIKKAYAGQVPNPATGAAWTLQDAITALLNRGYDQADAETLLAE